jgi:thermitase
LRRIFPRRVWELRALNSRTGEFEARLPRGARSLSVAAAWDASYRLRGEARVIYAEPLFEVPNDEQFAAPIPPGRLRRSSGGGDNDPGTERDYEWSLSNSNVLEAWTLFGSRPRGGGIVVGHPDTGYTDHPEIAGPRLRIDDGYDFEDDDADPRDPLVGGVLRHPGHGTGTSSVIFSARGFPAGAGGPEFVSGSAPGASLIPIRTTKSVVLLSMSRLTRAIYYAVEQGAHVISISLGGPFGWRAIHSAVREAERQGVIVLCAAGNYVGFVVFPAAFDEVIAVAASRIDDEPWDGSCRGAAVDITAPGSSVWRASTESDDGAEQYDVSRGSGTSFAVALTAGVAALWLSYHGRTRLIALYGRDRLAAVFKQLLQRTCRTPSGWDASDYGPGIVNARALLDARLPAHAPAPGSRILLRRAVSDDRAVLEQLVHQLAPAPRSGVARALAEMLKVDESALPRALDDVGAELAMAVGTDPVLRRQLRDAANVSARGRPARAVPMLRTAGRRATLKGGSTRMRSYLSGARR